MLDESKAVISLQSGETGKIVDKKEEKGVLYYLVHIFLAPLNIKQWEIVKKEDLTNYH